MIYHSVYYLKSEVFLGCITFILLTAPQRLCYQWSTVVMCHPLHLPRRQTFSRCRCFVPCRRFMSDFGPEGYDCVCQHRLLQGLQGLNVGPEHVRTYPPCLLEWTANRKRAHTVLHIHCFDGETARHHVCPLGLAAPLFCSDCVSQQFFFSCHSFIWVTQSVEFTLPFFKLWEPGWKASVPWEWMLSYFELFPALRCIKQIICFDELLVFVRFFNVIFSGSYVNWPSELKNYTACMSSLDNSGDTSRSFKICLILSSDYEYNINIFLL